MKGYLVIAAMIIAIYSGFAENEKKFEPNLKSVTVYRAGARLTYETKVEINKETKEIVLSPLPSGLDPMSLQVAIKGEFELISASTRTDFLYSTVKPDFMKKLEDSVDMVASKLAWNIQMKQELEAEESLLKANFDLGTKNGVSFTPSEVLNLASMYRTKSLEIRKSILTIAAEDKQLNLLKSKLDKQLDDYKQKYQSPVSEVVLQIDAKSNSTGSVKLNFIVNEAGWSPVYDMKSEGINKPVQLVYKSQVYQQTGFDWSNAQLIISTGNPQRNNSRPILSPLYIDYRQYYAYKKAMVQTAGKMQMMESNIMAVSEDLKERAYNEPASVTNGPTDVMVNMEYEVKGYQNVPADGKEHTFIIDKYELPVSYSYHTVPKLDNGVFLLAKVIDWSKYNLIAATANIFFEGAYVGQSAIDPSTTADTLLLSFGRDDRVNVKYQKLNELCETKWLGANKKETRVYEVTIRNNKSTAIEIETIDQLPISRQDDIKVEIENISGADYNLDSGRLLWKQSIQPGQVQKIRFTYTVKYPKDKDVAETY